MPASAHHGADDPAVMSPLPTAQVIDLASRRKPTAPAPAEVAEVEYLEDPKLIAQFDEKTGGASEDDQAAILAAVWEQAVGEHGVSLADPVAAGTARAVAELIERMLYGCMTIRHGDATRGIEPNPDDGIDHTGAQVMLDLVRGLRDAADTFSPPLQG